MPINHQFVSSLANTSEPDVVQPSHWNAAHTNPELAEVNGLVSALAGKSDVGHTHPGGGADPWTYVVLDNDFTTSSGSAVDTGLSFTPLANTRYEFSGLIMARTATTTVNPRTNLVWSSGLTDGVASINTAQSSTSQLTTRGNIGATLAVAVGGLPNTTQSWPVEIRGIAIVGPSPSGTIRVQLQSETAGTNVTFKAGSFLCFRSF